MRAIPWHRTNAKTGLKTRPISRVGITTLKHWWFERSLWRNRRRYQCRWWFRMDSPSNRNLLEQFWQGVLAMPARMLFVARLDNVICGAAQLILPPRNNEAQSYNTQISGFIYCTMGKGQGLSRRLLDIVEKNNHAQRFCCLSTLIYVKHKMRQSNFTKVQIIHWSENIRTML